MIGQAVTAIRKAVASVIAFVAFCFEQLGRLFALVAGKVYPLPFPAGELAPPPKEAAPKARFTVLRWQGKRHWALYDGTDGGEARRRYEAVRNAGETGRMEFQMTIKDGYVVRGVYENGE